MTLTVPFGYGSQRVTIAQLRTKATWRNSHPELRRRCEAMFIASGGTVGVGTAWRDPAAQDAERARRLRTHTGAQMAPSARSWHCAGGAIDIVGNQHWAKDNCHRFGLYYATWAGESLWHQQIDGMPHARPSGASVSMYVGHHEIVDPPTHTPEPHPTGFPPFRPEHGEYSLWPFAKNKPTVRVGFHGDAAKYAQAVIKRNCGPAHAGMIVDGVWGPQSAQHFRGVQRFFGKHVDGWIGTEGWGVVDMLASSS